MDNLALYIHWPFCESKCPYCDFNSHVRDEVNQKDWLKAYLKELESYKEILSNRLITSVFFGGGTPSLMSPDSVAAIISYIKENFKTLDNLEISIEANPSSSEIENFKLLKQSGVNRLSLGIQSFNDKRLKFLGRKHDSKQAKKAIEAAAKTYDNFSFDLIYNLPNQTKEELRDSLNEAFRFGSPHLSLYQLTIEKGTQFFKDFKESKFKLPEEDTSVELYDFVLEECKKQGLERYEISNYAKPGKECKHNLSYWNYDEYLGIGAGAHSRIDIDGIRTAIFDIHNPEKWLENVKKSGEGIQNKTILSKRELVEELIFMGFRTVYGLSLKKFKKMIGIDFYKLFENDLINSLEKENYVYKSNDCLILTESGIKLHSAVVKKLCMTLKL